MKYEEPVTKEILQGTDAQLPEVAPGEIILGSLVEINEQGQPVVQFHSGESKRTLAALTTLGLTKKQIGRQVALLFANGDPKSPIIMGMIHSPLQEMLETFGSHTENSKGELELESGHQIDDVQVDGERIVLKGKKEIVLKCGEASITLTRSGKVLIRGKYLLNRSSGVNRIMGGSVQVN